MSVRIRYSSDNEGNFISVKKFFHPTNGARYVVKLVPSENQWMVLDDASGLVAASGRNTDLRTAKVEAKNALVELGIQFTSEKGTKKPRTTNKEVAA